MNPQPADYKSAALPIELHQQVERNFPSGRWDPGLTASPNGGFLTCWSCLRKAVLIKHNPIAFSFGLAAYPDSGSRVTPPELHLTPRSGTAYASSLKGRLKFYLTKCLQVCYSLKDSWLGWLDLNQRSRSQSPLPLPTWLHPKDCGATRIRTWIHRLTVCSPTFGR